MNHSKFPLHKVSTAAPSKSKPALTTAARTVTAGNPQQALKDKGVIDSGCSRHMMGNMSYLSDFEELNGGYNAPSFVHPTEQVKTHRPSVKPVETSIPAANHKTAILNPKSHRSIRNRKACFACKSLTHLIKDYDYCEKKMAQTPAKNQAQKGNHQQYAKMTLPNPQRYVVPTAVLTKSKLVSLPAARQVTTAVSPTNVTRPRPAKNIVTKPHSPPRRNINHSISPKASHFPSKVTTAKAPMGNPQHALKDKGVIDSGCSRHMTWNMSYLFDFEEINGGYFAFGRNPKGGKIPGKGKIKIGKLDFDAVYFVKKLKFNLFSVSQMCDKKNNVLFTDTECIILFAEFKLPDENQVLLRVPRENNMYNVYLKNIVPSGDLTCLFAKATLDESNLWHRKVGHINFKTMNKMVKGNNVRGLPSNFFKNNHICVACKKGKQHRASCKSKPNRILVTKPQNKTPYKLLLGRTPSICFMRPFGCLVTILNTLDPLGSGPTWLFDIDTLTKTMNYQPVIAGNQSNPSIDPQNINGDAAFEVKEPEFEGRKPESEVHVSPSSSAQTKKHGDKTKREARGKSPVELSKGYKNSSAELEDFSDNSINEVNAADTLVPAVRQMSTNSTNTFSAGSPSNTAVSPTHGKSSYMDPSQYPDDLNMPELEDITYSNDEKDVGVEADFTNLETNITEELLQFKIQKVWVLVDLPNGKRAIGTKWVFRNKKDERGIVVGNKARLVAQGHTQEEGIDYEEVFAPVARIEDTRLFLAYVSFMGFMVYQMDVKSAFLYRTIKEEVYFCQPPGFEDPDYPNKVYKVVNALYGLHQAPRAWYENLANYLLENGFQRGKIDQTLFIRRQKGDILLVHIYVDDIIFVKQKPDGILISQDKYVAEILRKFGLTDGKSASTHIDTEKPLLKDPDDISREATLGLWYPKDSPFNLVAYSDSDYAGASLDKKSTTGGCQFLGCRLISWHCKKQTVIATSFTEAEYVAAASFYAQVNDVMRLQALVDKKKMIMTEAIIQEALRLDDGKSIDCLPNEKIFTKLSRMGTSWNEFSSSMALVVICLSTGRKFNLSRKGILGVETPLFEGMIVAQQAIDVPDEGAASVDVDVVPAAAEPSIPSPTPINQPPPPS
nr:hypothetical protein [Tanacetum cinerariifolium]